MAPRPPRKRWRQRAHVQRCRGSRPGPTGTGIDIGASSSSAAWVPASRPGTRAETADSGSSPSLTRSRPGALNATTRVPCLVIKRHVLSTPQDDRRSPPSAAPIRATTVKRAYEPKPGDYRHFFPRRKPSERFGTVRIGRRPTRESWGEFRQGTPGSARRNMWALTVSSGLDYDVIIFDLGPSLGALNHSVLLGSSNFVTPMAAVSTALEFWL
jgi:hypothetical protein